uniref:Uncharacterized protein n=1 Tax=Romanomermis culicivorax TaxID=13658 RepID=A0A915IXH1_ROMCU
MKNWTPVNDQPVEFCSQLSNIPPLPWANDMVNNSQTLWPPNVPVIYTCLFRRSGTEPIANSLNVQPENPLSIGKNNCNFLENNLQPNRTERNENFPFVRYGCVDCIPFRSAEKGKYK